MRLIDADALLELVQFTMPINNRNAEIIARCVDTTRELIEAQPTIDAVEVVRCKDCKYNVANMERDPLDKTDYTDIVCSYWMSDGLDENDFCSRGKRKENDSIRKNKEHEHR